MDLVHSAYRGSTHRRAVAVFGERADQEVRVVVPFARPSNELVGRSQYLGDRWYGERPEEGEFGGTCRVERELEARIQVNNPLGVVHRVESQDLAQVRTPAHLANPNRDPGHNELGSSAESFSSPRIR